MLNSWTQPLVANGPMQQWQLGQGILCLLANEPSGEKAWVMKNPVSVQISLYIRK